MRRAFQIVWQVCGSVGLILVTLLACSPSDTSSYQSTKQQSETFLLRNPFIPGFYAEASIASFEGKYYLYATIDPWDDAELAVWESSDFHRWILRRINWPTRDQCTSASGRQNLLGSPDVIRASDGYFYMFVTSGREIWAGRSEHPLGPWYDANGHQPLLSNPVDKPLNHVHASCFVDTDGQAYLYWTTQINWDQAQCYVAPIQLGEKLQLGKSIPCTPDYFFEAPEVFKHQGTYYMVFSDGRGNDHQGNIRYAVAQSALGPWETVSTALTDSAGHPDVFIVDRQYYLMYHRIALSEGYHLSRQLYIDSLIFTPKGALYQKEEVPGIQLPDLPTADIIPAQVMAASSFLSPQYKAENSNDLQPGTSWIAAPDDLEPWIIYDLGESREIETTYLWLEKPFGVNRYRIDYSNDLEHWQAFSNRQYDVRIMAPFVDSRLVQARYLRITFFYVEGYDARPAIAEFEIE